MPFIKNLEKAFGHSWCVLCRVLQLHSKDVSSNSRGSTMYCKFGLVLVSNRLRMPKCLLVKFYDRTNGFLTKIYVGGQ